MPRVPEYGELQVRPRAAGGRYDAGGASAAAFGGAEAAADRAVARTRAYAGQTAARSEGLRVAALDLNARAISLRGAGEAAKARKYGAIGKVLDQGSDLVFKYLFESQARQDEADILDWESRVADHRLQLWKPGGAMRMKGRNAIGITTRVEEGFRKLREEMPKNARIAGRAERVLMNVKQSTLQATATHEAREYDSYVMASRKAALNRTVESLILAPVNENGEFETLDFDDARENAAVQASGIGVVQGMDGEMTADLANSAVSRGIVGNMQYQVAMGRPDVALKTLEAYGDMLDAEDRLKIEPAIRDAAKTHAVRAEAAAIVAAGGTLEELMERVGDADDFGGPLDPERMMLRDLVEDQWRGAQRVREDRIERGRHEAILNIATPGYVVPAEVAASMGINGMRLWTRTNALAVAGIPMDSNPDAVKQLAAMPAWKRREMTVADVERDFLGRVDLDTTAQLLGQAAENERLDRLVRAWTQSTPFTDDQIREFGLDVAQRHREKIDKGPAQRTTSDYLALGELERMVNTGTLHEISDAELVAWYGPQLTSAHLTHYIRLKQQVVQGRAGEAAVEAVTKFTSLESEYIERAARQYADTVGMTDERMADKGLLDAYHAALDRTRTAVAAHKEQTGRPATTDELLKVIGYVERGRGTLNTANMLERAINTITPFELGREPVNLRDIPLDEIAMAESVNPMTETDISIIDAITNITHAMPIEKAEYGHVKAWMELVSPEVARVDPERMQKAGGLLIDRFGLTRGMIDRIRELGPAGDTLLEEFGIGPGQTIIEGELVEDVSPGSP